jgi:hypothetical protein
MTYAALRSSAVVTSNATWAALTTSAYSVVHWKSAATGRWSVLPKSVKAYSTPSLPEKFGLDPKTMPLKPMSVEQCVSEGLSGLLKNRSRTQSFRPPWRERVRPM